MRGIDAQIKRRMMQDPRRLQQNYKQSRDILDLIALQMIKSEKDQKKKDMMLKMQGNPATIKQQMEQDLVRQTKDDLVKQTSGIMQIQNAQKNKNLQKLLAGAGKRRPPPMGGIAQPFNRQRPKTPTMANPLAVGLAKAPAPNMQGMTRRAAQGGIIGFSAAGSVPDNKSTGEQWSDWFKENLISGQDIANFVKNNLPSISPVAKTRFKQYIQGNVAPDVLEKSGLTKDLSDDYLNPQKNVNPAKPNYTVFDDEEDFYGLESYKPTGPKQFSIKPKKEPELPKEPEKSGIESIDVGNVEKLFNEINTGLKRLGTPSYKGTEIQEGQATASADLMGTAKGLAETDLGKTQKDAFEKYEEQLGLTQDQKTILDDNIEARKTRLSDAENLFKEAYGNKEQNRMDDLISFLVGAGGTAGIGETLGRGTEASRRNKKARLNAMATARKDLENLFDKKVTAQENLINKELDIKNKAFDGSMKDKEIYGSLTEKGLSIMGTLTAEKMKGLSQDATNLINLDVAKFKEEGANLRAELSASSQVRIAKANNTVKVMVANLEGKLDQERIAVDREIKTLIEQGNQERALSTALNYITNSINATRAGYTKIYQGIISKLQQSKSILPEDQQGKIDELIKFYQDEEQLQVANALEASKKIADTYLAKLQSLTGVGNLSAEQMAEIDKILGTK
tara:strand:+ start:103 stop:2142 length:2040 start_codon:yes stop_codon:yes gene_type:complete